MQNQRHSLPPLDLLLGFEAAARHLSFTKAAAELFLTQSAISRQVQALEEAMGVALFQRRHRALLLTDAGQLLRCTATEVLDQLRETTRQIRGADESAPLNVTTTFSFASLWLIPRLPRFRARHPAADVRISADNRLVDLVRERIDVAIRYCAPDAAPPAAIMLFGEEVMPMCSPALLRDRTRPLRSPDDLRHHVLLHDDWTPREPWLEWGTWLQAHGMASLKPAGDLRFSHYDQMIQAAVSGQGVALGRMPLLTEMMQRRQLVAPFEPKKPVGEASTSSRSFFLFSNARSQQRPEVRDFCNWLLAEAKTDARPDTTVASQLPRQRRARLRRKSRAH